LVEHGGRKKHNLEILHPKRKKNNGILIVDTALESEALKFLAHLKTKKPADLSKKSAASLADVLQHGPRKLTTSDLPIWLVNQYIIPKCYKDEDSDWKEIGFKLLSYPIKDTAVTQASGDSAKFFTEASLCYWFNLMEKNKDTSLLGPQKEQKELFDKALSFHEGNKHFQALFFSIKPTLAGYPAAESLFLELYNKLFEGKIIDSLSKNSLLQNLLSGTQNQAEEKNAEKFAVEMQAASSALASVKEMGDLDTVAEHLETACLYSTDASILLMSAFFQQTDDRVLQLLQQASAKGSSDAKRTLHLLEEHGNWKTLQKSCFAFQKLLTHIRHTILSTSNWNNFTYKNQL